MVPLRILQTSLMLIGKAAASILNACFGWSARALFGQTTARERTHLSFVLGAAVAWPILCLGAVAPKIAAQVVALVPMAQRAPSWAMRVVCAGAALLIPVVVGLSVAARAPRSARTRSVVLEALRGFPVTLGLTAAFLIVLVSVPAMRFAGAVRKRKGASLPLTTDELAYHEVALKLCEMLNRHGFSLRRAEPAWWVAAPRRAVTWFGGDAFRRYLPSRLEHFVSPELEMTLYPSGLHLRGTRARLTSAQGLLAETIAHSDGLQTIDPKAQDLEARLRRLWRTLDETAVANRGSQAIVQGLEQVTHELSTLEIDFDDWQVLYRQMLQVGRAIGGQRQLLDAEATGRAAGSIPKPPSLPLPFGIAGVRRPEWPQSREL